MGELEQPLAISLDKIAIVFLRHEKQHLGRRFIGQLLIDYAATFSDETLTKKLPIIHCEDASLLILTLFHAYYLVNRAIVEIDDKVESSIGLPLDSGNLMYTNIIIHEVIGDRFANRLDLNMTRLIKPSSITQVVLEAKLSNVEFKTKRTATLCLSGEKASCFAQSHGLSLV